MNHFFFQAEDGIRDYKVTGVQTCALPIWALPGGPPRSRPGALRQGRSARSRAGGGAAQVADGFEEEPVRSPGQVAREVQIGRASCRESVWVCGVGEGGESESKGEGRRRFT